jgi:tRNA-dihydrouridine synthase A
LDFKNKRINRKISVAPMMDCTDRHDRYFLRLISKNVMLYSEMVATKSAIHGDRKKILGFREEEKPVALQVGGSDKNELAEVAKLAEQFGYDEININLGCPSKKVQKNSFGACLMKEPDLVAECINNMVNSCKIPVTAKTRIGVDEIEDFEYLNNFINKIKQSGCKTVILHARKALLKGLTPKQNLNIPKLNYKMVYEIKKANPELEIIINGGVSQTEEIKKHLEHCDGVMIGRAIYQNPYFLTDIEKEIFNTNEVPSREQIAKQIISYLEEEVKLGTKVNHIMRHTVGLYHGQPGSKDWKRYLSDNMMARDSDFQKAKHIMTIVQNNEKANQLNS